MGSRLRPVALCGAVLAAAGGAAVAAWAWAYVRGRARRPPPAPAEQVKGTSRQILVLGLDGAGKSSVLHSLATNQVKRSVAPTEGFNAVCINSGESQMEFLLL